MKKADKRANRSTKVPMRTNNTARLQDALYNIGAYSGQKDRRGNDLSYEKAVDGLHGRMTDAAIQKARDMGYEVDTEKGTVTRRPLEGNQKTGLKGYVRDKYRQHFDPTYYDSPN